MKSSIKNQKGFTIIELIIVLLVVVFGGAWFYNIFQLADCDFEADYKCEVVHGAGFIVPPAAVVTVWFDDDSEK